VTALLRVSIVLAKQCRKVQQCYQKASGEALSSPVYMVASYAPEEHLSKIQVLCALVL